VSTINALSPEAQLQNSMAGFLMMGCFIPLKRRIERLEGLTLMMNAVCLRTKAIAIPVMTTTQAPFAAMFTHSVFH
jgi:hypothetical protein